MKRGKERLALQVEELRRHKGFLSRVRKCGVYKPKYE